MNLTTKSLREIEQEIKAHERSSGKQSKRKPRFKTSNSVCSIHTKQSMPNPSTILEAGPKLNLMTDMSQSNMTRDIDLLQLNRESSKQLTQMTSDAKKEMSALQSTKQLSLFELSIEEKLTSIQEEFKKKLD